MNHPVENERGGKLYKFAHTYGSHEHARHFNISFFLPRYFSSHSSEVWDHVLSSVATVSAIHDFASGACTHFSRRSSSYAENICITLSSRDNHCDQRSFLTNRWMEAFGGG